LDSQDREDARQHPRFRLEVEVTVLSPTGGLTPGRTLEISERGMSAILPLELPLHEMVELKIQMPSGLVTMRAAVRNRNVFRHGFEFIQPRTAREAMKDSFEVIASGG
jgi:hypothetical protein